MTRMMARLLALRVRDERGDVPGWVLITVMSVGLIAAISQVAEDELRAILSAALQRASQ